MLTEAQILSILYGEEPEPIVRRGVPGDWLHFGTQQVQQVWTLVGVVVVPATYYIGKKAVDVLADILKHKAITKIEREEKEEKRTAILYGASGEEIARVALASKPASSK